VQNPCTKRAVKIDADLSQIDGVYEGFKGGCSNFTARFLGVCVKNKNNNIKKHLNVFL